MAASGPLGCVQLMLCDLDDCAAPCRTSRRLTLSRAQVPAGYSRSRIDAAECDAILPWLALGMHCLAMQCETDHMTFNHVTHELNSGLQQPRSKILL